MKNDVMPKPFDLKPDLLSKTRVYIGVLRLQKIVDRKLSRKSNRLESNFGMKAILSELKEPYETCYPETINQYKFVLISLTSIMDVENLIYTFEKYCPQTIMAKIIIGGFGVINIRLIVKYVDIAVFGRAEGQINEIINGFSFKNVWRKEHDPNISEKYEIRQPVYLLEGEYSVGCRNRCGYCQYAHIRQPIGKAVKYHPTESINTPETDWNGLIVDRPGKYITAWDGWSESTRLRVNKPVTNNNIISKLIEIGNNREINRAVSLKIYQIVGYPWETKESVLSDIESTKEMLDLIDKQITGKITLSYLVTPFAPEPMTPMQYEPSNIHIDWGGLLAGMKIYYGNNIKAFIIVAINGPFALLKRVWINRAGIEDVNNTERFKDIVFSSRLKRMPERHKVRWLLQNDKINPAMFGKIKNVPCDYIKTVKESKKVLIS